MQLILLLTFFIGIFTYYAIRQNIPRITRTPLWLCWLVLMTPALVMSLWVAIYGENTPLPSSLLLSLFLLCPVLYLWLVQLGRIDKSEPPPSKQDPSPTSDPKIDPSDDSESPKVRPITISEEKSLRECFPWGVYYLQKLDFFPQAILCRGKLRTQPDVAYRTVKENVESLFGERFMVVFQESLQGQPFFALVPNVDPAKQAADSSDRPLTRPWLALGLMLITAFTTTVVGTEMMGVAANDLQVDPSLLLRGLPYGLGVMAILGIHELSHYLAALHYKIRTTLPYFIPIPFFLGTFGAFIQMKSRPPHRKALFDVAIAGPLGGFLVTIPLLIWGLKLSGVVQLAESSRNFLNFQAINPRFSLLFTIFSKIALGDEFTVDKAIFLHPLAIAGYIGLIVTALNLMPIGQLDGGHIIHAVYGQRVAVLIGYFTRMVTIVLALLRPEFLLWAIIVFLIPVADQPALNDVTELDNGRDLLGLLSMGLLLLILLPVPSTIAQWLNV